MLRTALVSIVFSAAFVCLTGFSGCPGGEGEGEGGAAEGEGAAGEGEGAAGEGEGASGEGEGAAGEGEGAAGEGEGEGGGSTREFTCQSSTVVAQTSCNDVNDCAIGQIMLDCCGSMQATGVNVFDICNFGPAAGNCFQALCGCAAQPTVADDGTSAPDISVNATVACLDHVCTTTFPQP